MRSNSDVVYCMLVNIKMPTIVGIFKFFKHDQFHAELSLA